VDDLLTPYSEAIKSLFARTTGSIKPGLERTEALLAELGSPHEELAAIHVAGTNGKGSVVATSEALLRARGFKVGRYTSPHLIDFRERITVNGRPISEAEVLEFLERWIPTAEKMGATFFEVTTALAFDWLARQEVDFAVIETGLGGRLDSTNVLMPRVAAVTSIGLDHTDLLGDTLEAIAGEKAGIFKRGVPAVIGEPTAAIRQLLVAHAKTRGAEPVIVLGDTFGVTDIRVSLGKTSFTLRRVRDERRIETRLLGEHQARNTAIAIEAVASLGEDYLPPRNQISKALANVFLPGRFQRQGKFIFDVAHNPDGARTISETIRAAKPPRPVAAMVAVLADKDWRGIVRELAPVIDRFLFTNAPSAPAERSWDPAEAFSFALEAGMVAELEPDMDAAILRGLKDSGTLLITGSFHTVGDAMSRLQVSPFAA
jgi:dihydrofolate synthase/folylpolyglutamate synthase